MLINFFKIIFNFYIIFLYNIVIFINNNCINYLFFFSSRRRHTRFSRDWSSEVCSSDLTPRDETRTGPAWPEGRLAAFASRRRRCDRSKRSLHTYSITRARAKDRPLQRVHACASARGSARAEARVLRGRTEEETECSEATLPQIRLANGLTLVLHLFASDAANQWISGDVCGPPRTDWKSLRNRTAHAEAGSE